MDRRFLTEITEGYITNHNVFSEFKPKQVDLIRKTIYNDLCEVCDELREDVPQLYDKLYFSNRLYQNGVFENYLNIRYKSNHSSDNVLEEYGAFGIIGAAGSKISGLLGKAYTFIMGLSTFQFTFSFALLAIAMWWYNGIIGKRFFKFLHDSGALFEKVGDFISKSGKSFQLRYAIIQKNFTHCYKRAKIDDLNKINVVQYFNKFGGSQDFKMMWSQEQANILIECYVETTIEIIKLQTSMYLNCIKSTKAYDSLSKLSTSEFMAYIHSDQYKKNEFNVNVVCFEYFEIAVEQIKKFDDLINFFYRNESEKRQLTIRLTQAVQESRDEVFNVKRDARKYSTTKNISHSPNSNQNKKSSYNRK